MRLREGFDMGKAHPMTDLRLFNSLTRRVEDFQPIHAGEARVYSCGPTVYNYPHIGNMRAYVFADVLGRTLRFKGYDLTHVINITDVGHLTDDADAGEDKLEKAAAAGAQSIGDIARHYTDAFWADVAALNIRQPARWTVATEFVPQMIEFAKGIADRHCYELDSGLYFDVSTVADYGRLARSANDEREGRIEATLGACRTGYHHRIQRCSVGTVLVLDMGVLRRRTAVQGDQGQGDAQDQRADVHRMAAMQERGTAAR